jgi:hypothetical protein
MSKLTRLAQRLVMLFTMATAAAAVGCGSPDPGPGGPAEPTMAPAEPGTAANPGGGSSSPGGGSAADYAALSPAALQAAIGADFDRLQSLHIISAYSLVLSAEAQGASCYSAPCSLTDTDPVIIDYHRQAPRLHKLVTLAAETNESTYPIPGITAAQTDADLKVLRDLAVVSLGGLVAAQPAANPDCYNLPCPDDIALAKAENTRRASVAHEMAVGAAVALF